MRLQAMGNPSYENGFQLTLHERLLELPLSWKKPRTIFVNSMSDLFHADVPEEFIHRTFDVMKRASWHTFQVLTKRAERLAEVSPRIEWASNIWMGVSVENDNYAYRADYLKQTGANIKFLSVEPLLGAVPSLNVEGLDWVIVGGESGPGSRPMQEEWVKEVHQKCLDSEVAFFFKQWGGTNKKKAGRLLDGKTWDDLPALTVKPSEQVAA